MQKCSSGTFAPKSASFHITCPNGEYVANVVNVRLPLKSSANSTRNSVPSELRSNWIAAFCSAQIFVNSAARAGLASTGASLTWTLSTTRRTRGAAAAADTPGAGPGPPAHVRHACATRIAAQRRHGTHAR